MSEPVFFEIPIYRTSIQNYNSELKNLREKKYEEFPGSKEGHHFENFKQLIEDNYFYEWNYNEIIGFLNLYIFGDQLRINCWLTSNKRNNKGIRKKRFVFRGKFLEVKIINTKSNHEIFEGILNELKELNIRKFKKMHFDLRAFKVVGRFVDWKTLSKDLNSWSNPDIRNKSLDGTL